MFPIIPTLIGFLSAFYNIFDTRDINKLDNFINNYKDNDDASIAQFARGLLDDYDAIKNSLLYSDISNGPIEGINNKIKMIKRRSGNRAGVELLNAYLVLP